MVIIIGNRHSFQILDEGVCILYYSNTLRNGMNLTILSPAMGK